MRYIAATALMLVAAQFASARGEPPNATASQPPPAAAGPDQSAAKSTEELKKKVEEVGFKDVQIMPHMFVVMAKNPDGKNVSMIVDAETLQALQLGGDAADQDDDGPAPPDGSCQGPSSGEHL